MIGPRTEQTAKAFVELAIESGELTDRQGALALSLFATRTAEDGAAASGSRLSKVFKGLKATIVAHPYLAAAAAIAAIAVATVQVIKKVKEAQQAARDARIERGKTANDEAKNLQSLYDAYKDANAAYKEDASKKGELVEATNNLLSALGEEGRKVKDLGEDYADLGDNIAEVIKRKRLQRLLDLQDSIAAKRESINEKYGANGENLKGTYGIDFNTTDELGQRFADAIVKNVDGAAIEVQYEQTGFTRQDFGSRTVNFLSGSAEQRYKQLIQAQAALMDVISYYGISTDELKDNNIYQFIREQIDELKPDIEELNELIGETNSLAVQSQFDEFTESHNLPKRLAEFKKFREEFLEDAISSGRFEGDASTIESAVDAYLQAFSGFENFYGIPRFKKEIKSLSADTLKYLKNGGKATDKMRQDLQDFLDVNGYSPEQFSDMFSKISSDIDDSGNIIEQSVSSQIVNLTSLQDELATTVKALEAYKKAMEGGEKGDVAAEMAKIWKSATDSYKAGKVDTNEMRAAANLFFSKDFLAKNNMDLSDVGEALSSGIWRAVFSSDDYATNFVNYLQQHATELGDAVKVTTDAAGNVQFAYKSVSDLAEATHMSETSVIALLDALDVMGVQAMMSGEDMGELVDKLGLIPGETVKSAEGIQKIIQTLADDGIGYWDIQGTLNSLESAGMIDTSGIANIGTMIAEATKYLDTLDAKEPEVEVSADASKANGVISALEERIAALTSGEHTVVFNARVNGGAGVKTGVSNTVALANASGTRNAKGGKTYVNELGPETVIQDGVAKEYNDGKPALIDTKPGDIILPADVTADAKRNGHKVKVFGSAATGIGYSNRVIVNDGGYSKKKKTIIDVLQDVLNNASKKQNGAGGSGGSGGSGNRKSGDGDKIDWIEIAIDRINRKVQSLAKVAESTYKKLSSRLSASKDEISTITDELDLQQKAYRRYMQEASSVGLDEGIAKLVRDGTVDIRQYDKDTVSLINDYKKWYEKALACSEAVSNLHDELASLYEARFEYAQKDFDNQLGVIEHRIEMYNKALETHETKGYMASAEYYSALADVQKSNISTLQNELKGLNKYFNDAMNSGEIEKYSEAWYSMKSAIFDVEEALADANNQLIEYANSMREIQWSYFDYARDRIAKLTEESDFLIDLMSNSELFDDNGKFNDRGIATVGLHAQNFDTYMAQADAYFKEMQKIEEQIARDPYNTTLIQRRDELLGLQQDAIKSAEAEKQAVKSLVEEGIGKELDALKELIDAYEESLDSAKDLYEYQKKISDKSANIAAIQKQLAAYANDSSEENRARVQKLQENLRKAQEDLQETEYDQYIKDQKELLSDLYDEYEDVLNARLDDIESLFSDMIDLSNAHADEIYSVLQEISGMVGYSLSSGVDDVWNNTAYDSVGRYGDDLTMVNNYLSKIEAYISAMYDANNERLTGSVKQYATGGLVDYTGLAMVDGTPSRPELMLNANDTANFLALRDALDSTPYLSALAGRSFAAHGTSAVGHGGTTIGEVNTTIQIDHVQDYNDMISQMQKDSKFEKMLRAMTTDIAVGGSTMKKNRFQF